MTQKQANFYSKYIIIYSRWRKQNESLGESTFSSSDFEDDDDDWW